nr:hypothetical protein [uncultured Methanoregula sp.]
MSEKGENDKYRDRIKKADDGHSKELERGRAITNKEEKGKKKGS